MALFRLSTLKFIEYHQVVLVLPVLSRNLTSNVHISMEKPKPAHESTDLKSIIAAKIPKVIDKIRSIRKNYGSTKVRKITLDMMYGGMVGVEALIYETSVINPHEGIRFRGYSIPECQKLLPKTKGSEEPLPEGIFWLLMTGNIPNEAQVAGISKEWIARAQLPVHIMAMLNRFPRDMHPMSKFSCTVIALSFESKFAQAHAKGIDKISYWEYVYEDAMDLIAKLPTVAAFIYRNSYKEGEGTGYIDENMDWTANFTSLLGFENPKFTELMRLYLTIHSDHEGGNVCAHTTHLVGSSLANPYLSFAAGLNGLAGPLNSLTTQDVLVWLTRLREAIGQHGTDEDVKKFVLETIKSGHVIPGYGHAILKKTDPRYICLREFAQKHLTSDPLFKLVSQVYRVVPSVLMETGKVRNPWPNTNAHSGVLLQYYGMTQTKYYSVLFGVSRALGVLASLVWDRALGLPIEYPVSLSTDYLMKELC